MTVENGAVAAVEECHVDVLRWSVCRVDVDGAGTTGEVLDRVSRALSSETGLADGRALAIRVELAGSTACHDELSANPHQWVQEIRALAAGVSSADVLDSSDHHREDRIDPPLRPHLRRLLDGRRAFRGRVWTSSAASGAAGAA